MESNIYAAPEAELEEDSPGETHYGDASMGQRFLNFLIDQFSAVVMSGVVGAALGFLFPTYFAEVSAESEAVLQLLGLASMLGYYVAFEALLGRTLGKFITGTRVISARGGAPSFGQIFGRSCARFVPFEAFSYLGGGPTGWHDRWSGTRVVKLRGSAQDRKRVARQAERKARLKERLAGE